MDYIIVRSFRLISIVVVLAFFAYALWDINNSGAPIDSVLEAQTYQTERFELQAKLFKSANNLYARVSVPMAFVLRNRSDVLLYASVNEKAPNSEMDPTQLTPATIEFLPSAQEIRFRFGAQEAIYDTEALRFSYYPYM